MKYRLLLTLFGYYIGVGVAVLNPAIQFGHTHLHETRCPSHHVNTFRFKSLSLVRSIFAIKHLATWWNSLPFHLLTGHSCISKWPIHSFIARDCDLIFVFCNRPIVSCFVVTVYCFCTTPGSFVTCMLCT